MGIPADYSLFFLPSATEAWERITQNCISGKSFHLVNGSFSEKFYKTVLLQGRKASSFTATFGEGFFPGQIDVPGDAELISLIANETSTGVQMPPADITWFWKNYPDKLIAVDVVTAAPHAEINYAHTDLAYVSVQKGFGMPAGLALLVVSPRALDKARRMEAGGLYTGAHHSFANLHKNALLYQTPCTPNVLFIHLLGKVAEDMLREGISVIREQTRTKAEMLYAWMAESPLIKPYVNHPPHRSETVIVGKAEGGSGHLISALKLKGLYIGSGYSQYKNEHIRIANFPAHSIEMMEILVQEMKTTV
jgi:phosphoserine aminotransferase